MIKGFNFSLHFTLDPIQLLTFSQKKATLIQVEKRCVRIFFFSITKSAFVSRSNFKKQIFV